MPSKSYQNYMKNKVQVDKLVEMYDKELACNNRRGKRSLDYITRAALMFLCSSWEVYIEQITEEVGRKIVSPLREPDMLPKVVKKTISKKVKNALNEIEPIEFASNWKEYYLKMIIEHTKALNTPKKSKIYNLFLDFFGIEKSKIEENVVTLSGIDEIVSTRGDIAHNVYAETYLKRETLIRYYDTINKTVIDIELMFYNVIPELTHGNRPWQNTYINT